MNISDQFVQNLISLMTSAFPKGMNDEQLDEFVRHFFNHDDNTPHELIEEIKKKYKEIPVD